MWVNNRLYFGGDRFFLMEQALGNAAAQPHRLLSKPLANITKAKLTIYFDFSSPWSYIGFKQVRTLYFLSCYIFCYDFIFFIIFHPGN